MKKCAVRRNVLLVTGDADLREVAAQVLAREGYRVVTAAHSGHALLASITSGRIDVLLAELALDDMSGRALGERLRRHHPDMRDLYFADAGAPARDGVIVRPFTRDDLLAALDALCATATSAAS